MDRNDHILRDLPLHLPGLEIGPSYNPLVRKRDGYNVKILDHLDRDGLVAKYHGHNVDLSAIEEVDYIWSGQPLAKLVGEAKFHWVIASHVIEHTPDLIGFLNDVADILVPGGALALAVPDKRFCFDYFRATTNLAHAIDTHLNGANWPTIGAVVEHYINAASVDGQIIWAHIPAAPPVFIHDLDYVITAVADVSSRQRYHDAHSWTFTPASFRLLIHDLQALGYITLREKLPPASGGGEFYVRLSTDPPDQQFSRAELAAAAALER